MTDVARRLTVDEAVAEFSKRADAARGPALPAQARTAAVETFEDAERRRFQFAEHLLSLACPDPRQCADHRCRRHRLCRHVVDVHAVRSGARVLPPSRRSPGAWAMRYAIWESMNGDIG